jgi:hypothetical protein
MSARTAMREAQRLHEQADPTAMRAQRWYAASLTPALKEITDPAQELPLLLRAARLGAQLIAAKRALAIAERNWRSFSLRHSADDPAHAEHDLAAQEQRRVIASLNAELDEVHAELAKSIELERAA